MNYFYIAIGINDKNSTISAIAISKNKERLNKEIELSKHEGYNDFFILDTSKPPEPQHDECMKWLNKYNVSEADLMTIMKQVYLDIRLGLISELN
jgi:hypothetical protein